MSSKKEIAAKPQQDEDTNQGGQALAVYDYGEHADSGFENQSREDYAIPFLGVLQGLSPQLEELDGAKPGMVINTVTNDLYKSDVGVGIIPCATQHVYVEWKPRDQGGGFVAVHELDSEVVKAVRASGDAYAKNVLPNGNELLETYYVYGIHVRADGTTEQVVIAFVSTKIKIYKQWMTKARGIQIVLPDGRRIPAPLFAHVYRLKTFKEKNTKGEFFNWTVAFDGADAASCRLGTDNGLFQEAVAFHKLVSQGKAKVDFDKQTPSEEGPKGDDPF